MQILLQHKAPQTCRRGAFVRFAPCKRSYFCQMGFNNYKENKVSSTNVLAFAQKLNPEDLGDEAYKAQHGVKYAYHGGAMANGIASVEIATVL